MKKEISTTSAPAAIGPYSQAIGIENMVFLSGQLGVDPSTSELVSGGIKQQTEQVFKNIGAILEKTGLSLYHVVKTTVFLSDMNDFTSMNEIYAQHFQPPFPARSTIAVKALPKNALVEIEVVAVSKE